MGSVADGVKMSDGVSGQIPIWIDAGYMVTPNILVGLYGQYGFVQTKNCPAGASCSAHDFRIGVQGQYHLMPTESADPWLGLGVGYESLGTSFSGGGASIDTSTTGLEFLNLQGGADFKLADAFALGPFLSFSLGEYSSTTGGSIDKKAMHEWLTLGVKGTFGL
jgi:outer membrane protein W